LFFSLCRKFQNLYFFSQFDYFFYFETFLQNKKFWNSVSVDKQANNDDVFQFDCEGKNHIKTEFQKTDQKMRKFVIKEY